MCCCHVYDFHYIRSSSTLSTESQISPSTHDLNDGVRGAIKKIINYYDRLKNKWENNEILRGQFIYYVIILLGLGFGQGHDYLDYAVGEGCVCVQNCLRVY